MSRFWPTEQANRSRDPNAAILLQILMSDISEESYAAGWIDGLEYSLWDIRLGGDRGHWFVDDDEVASLQRLSFECGGWWVHDDELRFVPHDEWARIYAKHYAEDHLRK
jgi:hypothetical protein